MTTTITRTCPAWCADHEHFDITADLCEEYEQHRSASLAWSDDGATARLETVDDDPAEVSIYRDGQWLDVVVTSAELRRLADALVTLAERMDAGR
jgi:hypothetical protein